MTPQKMAAKETTGAVMNEDLLTIFSLGNFFSALPKFFSLSVLANSVDLSLLFLIEHVFGCK